MTQAYELITNTQNHSYVNTELLRRKYGDETSNFGLENCIRIGEKYGKTGC